MQILMRHLVRIRPHGLITMACLLTAAPVLAQETFPARPIRLILGFSAGGISDVLGRTLAAKMSTTLGHPMVVENKPGAGSTIAGDFIAKSPPDGYTIWLQDMTSHAINAALYPKLPYDSIKDFTPVTLVAFSPLLLAVHPSQPVKNVQELIDLLKANPGKLSYATAGAGTPNHLAAELLKRNAGIPDVTHVPYKGSAPSAAAILANEITFSFLSMPPAIANVAAGKLRALAVTSVTRVGAVPQVPTMVEAGVPDFDIVVNTGILAPARIPAAIVARLNAEFAKAVADPEVKTVFGKVGAEGASTTPEAMRALMEKDIARLAPLVKASGAKID